MKLIKVGKETRIHMEQGFVEKKETKEVEDSNAKAAFLDFTN
jgi:hypothetical protein